MVAEMKTIQDELEKIYGKAKEILTEHFSNLVFHIAPEGRLTCWVRTPDGRDGAGIQLKYTINVGQILIHQWRYLEELNELVAPAHNEPDKFFYCTECGQVKPKEEFEAGVFAGYYCKECAKKPEVVKLIAQSHERGFYD